MKSVYRTLAATLVLAHCLALTGAAMAQEPNVAHAPALSADELARLDARATELIGMKVRSPNGEVLGDLEELVLDVSNAHVRYGVLAYGGSLGYGARMAAFPLSLFRPGRREGELTLYVSPEQFREAPSFEADAWPNWLEARYANDVDRFFLKDEAQVETAGGQQLMRAADVVGRDVNDQGSRSVGEIEDAVVNLGNGQIRYLVLAFTNRLGFNERLVPLPVTAFRFPERPDINVFLTLDRERVAKARGFDEDDWPELHDPVARNEMESALRQLESNDTQQGEATGGGEGEGEGEGASDAGER